MKAFILRKSSNPKKKYDVYVPRGDRLKKVSFGAKGYSDYTIHKDKDRRERYRARHQNDRLSDPYSAGFWSMYVLWNKVSLKSSFQDAVKRAKRLIKGQK